MRTQGAVLSVVSGLVAVVVILFYLAKTTGRCAYFKDSQGKQHMEEILEDPKRGKKTERERHKETKRGRKATKLDHNYKLDIRDTIKQKRHIWLHSITGKDKTLKMRKIQ